MVRHLEEKMVVLDATVLVNFTRTDEILRLDGLSRNYKVPSIVFEQLKRNVTWSSDQKEIFKHLIDNEVMEIVSVRKKKAIDLLNRFEELDIGDAESLILAQNTHATLATDDLGLRKIAQDHGVDITGTIGLLYSMIKRETISLKRGSEILKKMIKHDFYSSLTPSEFKREYRKIFDD